MVPAIAAARSRPITGTLSKPGYTLIALADSGKASSVLVKKHSFKLRPPATKVTLQLRAPDGVYAGPVVLGKENGGKLAIVGVKAGAKLGKVIVKGGKGYAKPKQKLAAKFLNAKRTATAKKGVPIGAGKFGRVRVKKLKGPSSDPDLDGIPNVFDVDDNGNLVLDNVDPSSTARASEADSETINSLLDLGTGLDQTVNVDALDSGGVPPGERDALIEQALPTFGWFALGIASGDSVELDCGGASDPNSPTGWSGGLSWCAKGGTGTVFEPAGGPYAGQPFPACCDADGNGYGTMINNTGNQFGQNMTLGPHATADQIGTGDTLIERVTTGGVEHQLLHTLQYSVATVPALVSYDDGQGDSAIVSYPVSGPGSQPPGPPGPGTRSNPFPVKADPVTGHVTVRVTLWRPQRRPIPGEVGYSEPPSSWIDIGGLDYKVEVEDTDEYCPQSAYLSHGSNLADLPSVPGLRDLAADQPANTANTLAYTLDLTTCAASPVSPLGQSAPPFSFEPGDTRLIKFEYGSGSSAGGSGTSGVQGDQRVYFTRVS